MDWNQRFLQQARWTKPTRDYLYRKARLPLAGTILDVGCGMGALLLELQNQLGRTLTGLDISFENLLQAQSNTESADLVQGDAHSLPIQDESIDVCLCHYVLLWVKDPRTVVEEMRRVLKRGGSLLILAEPDYGGRIDYPPELAEIGRLQSAGLRRQGAEPDMGRQISSLLSSANLANIETGVMGGMWDSQPGDEEIEMEWRVLEADLKGMVPEDELIRLKEINRTAWQRGDRVLYVPTFFGYGEKK